MPTYIYIYFCLFVFAFVLKYAPKLVCRIEGCLAIDLRPKPLDIGNQPLQAPSVIPRDFRLSIFGVNVATVATSRLDRNVAYTWAFTRFQILKARSLGV